MLDEKEGGVFCASELQERQVAYYHKTQFFREFGETAWMKTGLSVQAGAACRVLERVDTILFEAKAGFRKVAQ